ncbi:uncharacterized protein BJ212DRAFT_1587655 [Suillus subaureus]|uniref:Uncharacterized protein n=1 Tax=Suillus subaureus TaxID=48587 RepID=A0A9P7EB51_9AGAM|nr:uncharacterized protein BJ212DRAFT_1587655 [Suillus subaureus]KAG1816524.1 hypothetical protein BJ212DRAFT_1587655 [Suillus subaureus]
MDIQWSEQGATKTLRRLGDSLEVFRIRIAKLRSDNLRTSNTYSDILFLVLMILEDQWCAKSLQLSGQNQEIGSCYDIYRDISMRWRFPPEESKGDLRYVMTVAKHFSIHASPTFNCAQLGSKDFDQTSRPARSMASIWPSTPSCTSRSTYQALQNEIEMEVIDEDESAFVGAGAVLGLSHWTPIICPTPRRAPAHHKASKPVSIETSHGTLCDRLIKAIGDGSSKRPYTHIKISITAVTVRTTPTGISSILSLCKLVIKARALFELTRLHWFPVGCDFIHMF